MMYQIGRTQVRRKFGNMDVYGTVNDLYRGNRGKLLVEVIAKGGWLFMSDPSHLEIIDEISYSLETNSRPINREYSPEGKSQQRLRP